MNAKKKETGNGPFLKITETRGTLSKCVLTASKFYFNISQTRHSIVAQM